MYARDNEKHGNEMIWSGRKELAIWKGMGDVINGLLLGGLWIWRLGKTNDRLACEPLLCFMFGIWVGVVTGDWEADIGYMA